MMQPVVTVGVKLYKTFLTEDKARIQALYRKMLQAEACVKDYYKINNQRQRFKYG